MTIQTIFSWKPGIQEAFNSIIATKLALIESPSSESVNKKAESEKIVVEEKIISQIDLIVQKVFKNSPKSKGRMIIPGNKLFQFFWSAAQRRVLLISKPPLPTINKSGGWKKGYIALMFDDETRRVDLVWSLAREDKVNKHEKLFEFNEEILQKKFGDTGFWPKVYDTFRYHDYSADPKPISRTFLFSERYHCSFSEVIKSKSLTDKVVLTIVSQVSMALDFIHKRGLAHCDVKPLNILLGKRAVLCDWDFLVESGKTKPVFEMYGTPLFASPECLKDNNNVIDFCPSDQYALGCSLQRYTDPEVFEPIADEKLKYFKMKNKESTLPTDRKETLSEILILLSERATLSDKALDELHKGKLELKDFIIFLSLGLLHPTIDKRPTAESVVAWTAGYKESHVENIIESILRV